MPYDFKPNKRAKSPEMAARAKKTKDAIVRGFGGDAKKRKSPARTRTGAY